MTQRVKHADESTGLVLYPSQGIMEACMNSVSDLRRRRLLKAAGAAAALSVLPLVGPFASAQGRKLKIGIIGSGNVGSQFFVAVQVAR